MDSKCIPHPLNFGTGQRLYLKAKDLIPGGTQLLSKRPEMFLPDNWPAYYSKAKRAEVWDLDGNRYLDMSTNGVGACILGYADPDVDEAVRQAIANGNMCTLNVPEEVELAELLCELHPWAEMVRYGKNGSDVTSAAIRLARYYSGKNHILFCGYHGWQDWYIGQTSMHGGVPEVVRELSHRFNYDDIYSGPHK